MLNAGAFSYVVEVLVRTTPTRFRESLQYRRGRACRIVARMKTEPSALRVLIADDFEPIRRRLAAMLADVPGVEIVGQSGNVQETLAAIRTLQPDVVTLDLSLPDGSGLDVLRQTRGEDARPVFIVLTNFSFPEYKVEALKHDAHAFLDKSREFGKAVELISRLAESAARQRKAGK